MENDSPTKKKDDGRKMSPGFLRTSDIKSAVMGKPVDEPKEGDK